MRSDLRSIEIDKSGPRLYDQAPTALEMNIVMFAQNHKEHEGH